MKKPEFYAIKPVNFKQNPIFVYAGFVLYLMSASSVCMTAVSETSGPPDDHLLTFTPNCLFSCSPDVRLTGEGVHSTVGRATPHKDLKISKPTQFSVC